MSLLYRTGNVLDCPERPVTFGHVVNDCGRWGAGFSGQLSVRYPLAERKFREWAAPQYFGDPPYRPGEVQVLSGVDGKAFNVTVANLCAQRGVGGWDRRVDYGALRACLTKLARIHAAAPSMGLIVMPRIGCGLGGGEWPTVRSIIETTLVACPVIVYSLEVL